MPQPAPISASAPQPPAEDRLARFVSVVLADSEDIWQHQVRRQGPRNGAPKLVLFDGTVPSAWELAQSAMGHFQTARWKVSIDLAFYRQLRRQLGARVMTPRPM
jgi:predicted metalloprotease